MHASGAVSLVRRRVLVHAHVHVHMEAALRVSWSQSIKSVRLFL